MSEKNAKDVPASMWQVAQSRSSDCDTPTRVWQTSVLNSKPCGREGCWKQPAFGVAGSRRRKFGSENAEEGMINVRNKTCRRTERQSEATEISDASKASSPTSTNQDFEANLLVKYPAGPLSLWSTAADDRSTSSSLRYSLSHQRDSARAQTYSQILSTCNDSRRRLTLKRHCNVSGVLFEECCMLTTRASYHGRRAGWSRLLRSSSKSSAHLF